jgi:hypothetical protein
MTYIDIFNALLARAKESARGSLDNPDISAINAFSSGWLASYIAGRAETDGDLLSDLIKRGMIQADDAPIIDQGDPMFLVSEAE